MNHPWTDCGLRWRRKPIASRSTNYAMRFTRQNCASTRTNAERRLTDPLDRFNKYIVAAIGPEIVGFISITPPDKERYSVDKYFSRAQSAFPIDSTLYEVRLLTVTSPRRGRAIAGLLMYAAFRWIESRGGTRIIAIGRRELRGFYRKAGLQLLGQQVQAGAVTYELMTATLSHLRGRLSRFARALGRRGESVLWQLDVPFFGREQCFHGGRFSRRSARRLIPWIGASR